MPKIKYTHRESLRIIENALDMLSVPRERFGQQLYIHERVELHLERMDAMRMAQVKADAPPCREDCEHRKGRFCILEHTNYCIRRAEDYYKKRQDDADISL